MTLHELIYEWLYENHQGEIKQRTLMRYECSVRTHISPFYGDYDINDITPRDLQKWINEIKSKISEATNRTLSPSSINTVVAVFKQSFRYAEDFGILSTNPSLKIKRVATKKDEKVRTFTKEEQIKIEKYIDNLNNDEYFVYILVLYTGLRLGEVMALTFKDINFKTGIMIINKSKYKARDDSGRWKYVIDTPKTK